MSSRSEPAVSKALVGPLRFIHFGMWGDVRQAYDVPRDTRDLRAAACFDHHRACDCREAVLSEEINEYRSTYRSLIEAASTVLRGHRIYDHGEDRAPGRRDVDSDEWKRLINGDGPLACQCTGCRLVRLAREHLHTDWNGVVE